MNFQNIFKARQAITDKHGNSKPQSTIINGMDCPVCASGKLTYRISSHNGHIAANCSTENCLSWME